MTSPRHNDTPIDLDRATLLRCAADDELTQAQQDQLAEHLSAHPQDEARIAFDQHLRTACSRVMAGASAPADLRQRIDAMVHDESNTIEHDAGGIEARASQTRHRSYWLTRKGISAVAASIALIFGGGLLWSIILASGPETILAADAAYVTSFVGDEHELCETDPTRVVKFTVSEIDEVPAVLQNILGKTPTLPDLVTSGLRFRDGGECEVPGGGRSVHMRFETDGSIGPAGLAVSLFIQRGRPQSVSMEPDIAYRLSAPTDAEAGQGISDTAMTVYGWYSQGLTYYLVTENAPTAERVRRAVGLVEAPGDGS